MQRLRMDNVADWETKNPHAEAVFTEGDTTDATAYIDPANEALDDAFDRYDVPVDRDDIRVIYEIPAERRRHHASAGFLGAELKVVDSRYIRNGDPTEYVIAITNNIDLYDEKAFGAIVRHELAHVINFVEDGYTVERKDNHAEWLKKLDGAPLHKRNTLRR